MSSTRVGRPEPCTYENCGSRRFHVGDDGYTYCDRGHQQSERGTVIAEDTGDFVTLGTKSRKKDSDAESTTSKASGFSGTRAFEHYLLCVQLVLRKQLRWLIETHKLPEELESLVRDLWALRLQSLRTRVLYDSETETEGQSSQVFSSQSESETPTGSQSSRPSRKRASGLPEEATNLIDTLSLCYIGALLLRIPVTVADIHHWTNNGELLYYRASRELPLGMRARLPPVYQELLEPQDLLKPQLIHQKISEILTKLHVEFGMVTPPTNTPLILYRWIQDLALPLEVFVATQRLARMLDVDGNFTASGSCVFLRYPEVRLVALVVVATKLLLPFDEITRRPHSVTDLSSLSMDWEEWAKAQTSEREDNVGRARLSFEKSFSFSESDCVEANSDALDAYMDWYEDSIASEDVRERGRAGREVDFRKALFRLFPVDSRIPNTTQRPSMISGKDIEARIRHMQSLLVVNDIEEQTETNEDVPRPGSFYRRFRIIEELSGPAKIFFENAAKLAGMPVDGMVQAVFYIERRLQNHEEALRKTKLARDSGES